MNASALVAVAARLALSKAPAEELAAHNAQLVTNDGEGTQRIDYVIIAVPAGRGLEVAPRLEQLARAEP
jgi:3-hydroxyisobutyrate dehydrogenase-like beta-hydroxyacid dehydrogenase